MTTDTTDVALPEQRRSERELDGLRKLVRGQPGPALCVALSCPDCGAIYSPLQVPAGVRTCRRCARRKPTLARILPLWWSRSTGALHDGPR